MDSQKFAAHKSIAVGHIVTDRAGQTVRVTAIENTDDDTLLHLELPQGRLLRLRPNLLVKNDESGWRLPFAFAEMSNENAAKDASGSASSRQETVIPVIEEQVQVDKRRVDTGRGVRVRKQVSEHAQDVEISLRQDALDVRHVPIGKTVDAAHMPQARQEGDTWIVPVLEEVLIIDKQLRLKEELHITRRSRQVPMRQTVILKSEQASVEQFDEGRESSEDETLSNRPKQENPEPDASAGHSPFKETIMAHTLVGVYDNSSQAQAAYNELVAEGFDKNHLQMSPSDETGMAGDASQRANEGEGMGASIGNFFRRIFGGEERHEETHMYSEAVRRGHYLLTVDVDNDEQSERATQVMNRFNPVDIDERAAHWRSSGWSQYDEKAPRMSQREIEEDRRQYARGGTTEGATIPVIQEELQVGKREVQRGGVRVYQRVRETPVEESVQLREEHVHVERRPVDQPASEADLAALQEGSFEVRETAEEAVVAKSARVVEEVVVSKDATERTEHVSDTVRRTDVEVEQLGAGERGSDEEYRRHFQSAYGKSGDRYEDYAQAYRYGSTLAADERYRGYRWNDAEPKVRQDWESQHSATPWEKAKDAVRYGWEKVAR